MVIICDFLAKQMNVFIMIFGVGIGILIVVNAMKLSAHKSQVEAALNLTNTTTMFNKTTQGFEDTKHKEQITPDSVRELEKTFNAINTRHSILSMMIPIFPLFGILGTVAGIIVQMRSMAPGTEFNLTGLDVALTSTFWGLIFAILLKILDALLPTKTINETELLFEDYDKKLNNSILLGNITQIEG